LLDLKEYKINENNNIEQVINDSGTGQIKQKQVNKSKDEDIAFIFKLFMSLFKLHFAILKSLPRKTGQDWSLFIRNLNKDLAIVTLIMLLGLFVTYQSEGVMKTNFLNMFVGFMFLTGVTALPSLLNRFKYGQNNLNNKDLEGYYEEEEQNNSVLNSLKETVSNKKNEISNKVNIAGADVNSFKGLYEIFRGTLATNLINYGHESSVEQDSVEWDKIKSIFNRGLYEVYSKQRNKQQIDVVITSVSKSKFCWIIRTNQIPGFNKKDLSKHLDSFSTYFKKDENDNVWMTLNEYQGKLIFRVYSEVTGAITIGDILSNKKVKETINESKYSIPFVLGLRRNLEPVVVDMKDIYHTLIAGASRSGKGWTTLYILYWISMFNAPTKASFVILDPKQNNETFGSLKYLPHTLKLESNISKYNDLLTTILAEAEFRGVKLKELGIRNLDEYCACTDDDKIEFPYLFIVIDEIIDIKNSMNQNEHERFMKLVTTLATKHAYVGIKLILIAQAPRNDNLDKIIKRQCTLKYAVGADVELMRFLFEENDRALSDITLNNKGDSAVKLNNNVLQIRQPTVSKDVIDTDKRFKLLTKTWIHLNPRLPKFKYLVECDDRHSNRIEAERKIKSNKFTSNSVKIPNNLFECSMTKEDLVNEAISDEKSKQDILKNYSEDDVKELGSIYNDLVGEEQLNKEEPNSITDYSGATRDILLDDVETKETEVAEDKLEVVEAKQDLIEFLNDRGGEVDESIVCEVYSKKEIEKEMLNYRLIKTPNGKIRSIM